MKHILRSLIAFLIVMTVSCDRIVDFPAEESGKIYIKGIMKDSGQSKIEIGVSQPVGGAEDVSPKDVAVILNADGKRIELTPDVIDEDILTYTTDFRFAAGQKLSIMTTCNGLTDAQAEVVVPAEIPDVLILRSETDSYRRDSPGQYADQLKTLWCFNIRLGEIPDESPYLGVQVLKRKQYEYTGNVPVHEIDILEKETDVVETDNLYVNTSIGENGTFSSFETDMVVEFEGGETVIAKAKERDGYIWTDAWVEPGKRTLYSSSYNPIMGENYAIYQFYEYKIRIYRLSSETYNYLRARFILNYSTLPTHFGFTPVTYTYTNIVSGIGLFGAVTTYESEWTRYE